MANNQNMNPLDTGEILALEMMNPNPKSSKTAAGPKYRVEFELHQEDWQLFMDAQTAGMILDCSMQVQTATGIQPVKKKPEKGPYGQFAKWVYQSGLLRTPKVWDIIGSENDHREWIHHQSCCICGNQDLIESTGEMKCEEAHIRTADNSGTAFKPRYISVPMCHADHQLQHQSGYLALMGRYCEYHDIATNHIKPDLQLEWIMDRLRGHAMEYLEEWTKQKIYEYFGVETMTWLSPQKIADFIELHEINLHVPSKFLSPGDDE